MNVHAAYNEWAAIYDSNANKTRDLEAIALREAIATKTFNRCLELGCGTGKNTVALLDHCEKIVAADFSEAMLAKAKEKIQSAKVDFVQADLLQPWNFGPTKFDLVVFSLVLEHIEDLNSILAKTISMLNDGALVYIGEYHPFKQYEGKKARFENAQNEVVEVTAFVHHLSDYTNAALKNNLSIASVKEYFDIDDESKVNPRILSLLLQKTATS